MTDGTLQVAVVGAGSFGRNHLRVIRELESTGHGVALIAAVEPNSVRAAECAAKYNIPLYPTVDQLLSSGVKLDAATVAVPTVHHYSVAAQLLEAEVDLLVEKPITAKLAEADDLIARAEKHSCVLQVGHLERFNPAVMAVSGRLQRPMFFEAHRLSVFSARAFDVDVVLDLMIHDLDIVLTFANSNVREVRAVGLPILSPKVDIANVRVEFESGCVANFTASRVSTERVRKLRFFEPRQYVSIDYPRQELLVIRMDSGVTPDLAAAIAAGKTDAALIAKLAAVSHDAGPAPGLSFDKPAIVPGEPLRLEFESFLEAIRTRREPRVTARQARNALALALEIQITMAEHAHRADLESFFAPPS